jgi:hypothetical protein
MGTTEGKGSLQRPQGMINSRMRWAGNVTCMGRKGIQSFMGIPECKSHNEDLNTDERMTLKEILEKWDGILRLLSGTGKEQVACSCKH